MTLGGGITIEYRGSPSGTTDGAADMSAARHRFEISSSTEAGE